MGLMAALKQYVGAKLRPDRDARLEPVRVGASSKTAIVFLHGFTGTAGSTWIDFLAQLTGDAELADWDIFSLGFASHLSLDLPVWQADPAITLCARGFVTKLRSSGLKNYECLAVVAHSMGGLVAQRAILDSDLLDGRLSHLILYGTPSGGLGKARFGRVLKYQLRDMASGSAFITKLRADWDETFGPAPPFRFITAAGDIDSFVPAESSLVPFAVATQEAIPGNHLGIVRPQSQTDLSYGLLKRLLQGNLPLHSATESARLAVETRQFKKAIELLQSGANGLDSQAIVTLALALESDGQSAEAMNVLAAWAQGKDARDPKGVLAGRLKRRWLLHRQQDDFDQALALYRETRDEAIADNDPEQAYYHGINVAFLLALAGVEHGPISPDAREAAELASAQAELAPVSPWRTATQAEAMLICGDLDNAVITYRAAAQAVAHLRDRGSMYVQATVLAMRVGGEEGRARIDAAFGVASPRLDDI